MWDDTICAIATPPGQGGVSVIRISGPNATAILSQIFQSSLPLEPRKLTLGHAFDQDGHLLDQCLAVLMPGPHSYTGEDVAELHCHGGFLVTNLVLAALLAAGARLAKPGEFTQRAFLNGRLDLSQAEAVIDVIEAKSRVGLALSQKQLQGKMGQAIGVIEDALLDILAEIELVTDYPEEESQLKKEGGLSHRLSQQLQQVDSLLAGVDNGKLYRDGIEIAIVGPTNAGKSSLLNALLEEDRAIVTEIPGTTRDTIQETLLLKGVLFKLTDTAGFRKTQDPVEALGIHRSEQALQEAEAVIAVFDASAPVPGEWFKRLADLAKPVILLWNKTDLSSNQPPKELLMPNTKLIPAAIAKGIGLDALKDALQELTANSQQEAERAPGLFNNRQKEALLRAKTSLTQTIEALNAGVLPDLAAIDLKEAWLSLGEITGKTSGEDILNRVFSRFCLGK